MAVDFLNPQAGFTRQEVDRVQRCDKKRGRARGSKTASKRPGAKPETLIWIVAFVAFVAFAVIGKFAFSQTGEQEQEQQGKVVRLAYVSWADSQSEAARQWMEEHSGLVDSWLQR